MSNSSLLYERYLNLIGFDTVPTGVEGLKEVVRNHLYAVPFENISKLLLFDKEIAGRPVSLAEYLDAIEFQNLGGTCYSNNPYLQKLLSFLGYEAYLLGADMADPDVHTCVRVKLDTFQYHIDAGYAAPFRELVRLDCTPYEMKHGSYTYRLQRGENVNRYEMEVLLEGKKIHGYTVNETPRDFGYFSKTIVESFRPGNTFMSCIRITRIFPDRTVELKNKTLTTCYGRKSHFKLLSKYSDIENAVANDLMMPNCPIRKAVMILEEITQKSFFDEESYPEKY